MTLTRVQRHESVDATIAGISIPNMFEVSLCAQMPSY